MNTYDMELVELFDNTGAAYDAPEYSPDYEDHSDHEAQAILRQLMGKAD